MSMRLSLVALLAGLCLAPLAKADLEPIDEADMKTDQSYTFQKVGLTLRSEREIDSPLLLIVNGRRTVIACGDDGLNASPDQVQAVQKMQKLMRSGDLSKVVLKSVTGHFDLRPYKTMFLKRPKTDPCFSVEKIED